MKHVCSVIRCTTVVAAVAALGLTACGSSATTGAHKPAGSSRASTNSPAAPIKIGNVGTYAGYAGSSSKPTADDLQVWAKTVNAEGGIDGHQVEVVVKDDGGTAAGALAAVKSLVQDDHVIAIVGIHESGLEAVWASYADSQHIPVVGGAAVGATFSTDPNFFPITNTGAVGGHAYGNAAKLFGATSITEAYCAEVPACKQADAVVAKYTTQLGLKHIPGQPVSASATNYTAQCQKFKDEAAGAVFLTLALPTGERLIAQCSMDGYHPLYIDNPQNLTPADLSNPSLNGVVLAADAPLWFGNGPGTAEYLAAMSRYAPGAVLNTSGTTGWYAGKLFGAALTAALKTNSTAPVTSQTIYDGLYALGPNFDLGGIVSPVTYAEGKPAAQQPCAWYAQIRNGTATAPKGAGRICLGS